MWRDCSDTGEGGESKEDSIERRRLMKTTSQLSSDKSIPARQRKYRYVKCTAPSDKRNPCGKNYQIHQHKQH